MNSDLPSFTDFDLASLAPADAYKLLCSIVMPRPIAWITSRDAAGTLNAAPFSFFNLLSTAPPIVAVSISAAPDRAVKDTLANLRAHPQFVVNMVSRELAEAMNITATNAPAGTDETALAGLELAPSLKVDVPRIQRSPAAMECRVRQEIATGGAATIVLADVLHVHVVSTAIEDRERMHFNADALDLVGRMTGGGGGYATTRDTFTIERRSWPLG